MGFELVISFKGSSFHSLRQNTLRRNILLLLKELLIGMLSSLLLGLITVHHG